MSRRKLIILLLGFALTALAMTGCSNAGLVYNVIDIDTDYDLVYSHGYRELVLARGAADHTSLIQATTVMIHPSFSPDGSRVAWLDTGSPSLGVSSTEVTAHVTEVLDSPQQSFDTKSVVIAGIDLDHKLMIEDAVPPLWLRDGSAVIFAHPGGVDRVSTRAALSSLSSLTGIKAMALAPNDEDLVLATASNLFALPLQGGPAAPLLADDVVPQFGNKQIRTVMFSPRGDAAVFALANTLMMLDLDSGEVGELFADNENIYWAAWLVASDEIVYLAGQERRRGRVRGPYDEAEGQFRLNVITTAGSFQRELFRGRLMDVREAVPALSPDGVFVSLTSRPYPMEIYIIATDGTGVSQLTHDGPNSYSAWRPAH